MARNKKTIDYLNQLQGKGYDKTHGLFDLYYKWKEKSDIELLSKFLDLLWSEVDNIRPKLGIATYNTFRGIALEEFIYESLNKFVEKTKFKLFWNDRILTEEFYIFEDGAFKKYPKYKAVDLTIGTREDNQIHPFAIISCKMWYGADTLDSDRSVFDNIRNRYPSVFGYGVCMECNVKPVSLISAQRTGLNIYNFEKKNQFKDFIDDIKHNLQEIDK
ncbi:MAG: hypothetical protein DRO62_02660 [Candidatus Altiarchaeales archaeon]|nr:MAG: hypothetical protein DRO62_02660 [Candidatus Altiarchaeales archaeon]